MNKTAIKNYAIWARVQLIESAKQRAFEYGITENGENKPNVDTVGGRLLSAAEKEQRTQLIGQIRQKGFSQVMEEAAYTWFNRFIALRFMEVNGYLPSKVRVFTDENGAFKPEILKEAMSVELDELDRNKVLNLLDKQDNEALYKYLLITQCNALNTGLPYMFEKIANWSELLFPANLLRSDSVVARMVSDIPEEDWTDAVQIIGWLYQFYSTELNEFVYDGSFSKNKVPKELIPAATTIYTPDWPIRYMVENSLGRYWIEQSGDNTLRSNWKYYVENMNSKAKTSHEECKPINIKFLDPCMGSGHILVYAFEVLMQIYTGAGWSERDAANSIIENNIYGLDIDDRAGQLAYFAVMMKARKYSRRILNGDIKPNVLSIQDSNWMTDEFIKYVADNDSDMKADLFMLRKTFIDAKEYGSILNVPVMKYLAIYERIGIIGRSYAEDLFQAQYQSMATEQLLPLVKQAEIMSQKYQVIVTNPPYLGSSRFSPKLDQFVKTNYPDVKADLSMVMYWHVMHSLLESSGYAAFITTSSWMYLSSFEKMRSQLEHTFLISSLVDFGTELFEGKVGHNPIVAWVTKNKMDKDNEFVAIRLVDYCYSRSSEKQSQYFNRDNYYTFKQKDLYTIPGNSLAYWISDGIIKAFSSCISIDGISDFTGSQHITSDNEKYLREFWEVEKDKIGPEKHWAFYAKGGEYRKWYGNIQLLVDTSSTAMNFYRNCKTANCLKDRYWYQEGITYSAVTSKGTGFRYLPPIGGFDKGGASIVRVQHLYYVLAVLNTKVADYVFKLLNPTINLQVKDVKAFPLIIDSSKTDIVESISKRCVEYSKEDWDSFETSYDFKRHPLIPENRDGSILISDLFIRWQQICQERFDGIKQNEEKLNQIFLELYSIGDVFDPNVSEHDISVSKADRLREIKSLISFAVGCMFGRYSVDKMGICFAGGKWDSSMYKTIIPDSDNIIPICDDDYFDDDIVGKFVDFVRIVYGDETLEENLLYISNSLGGKGTSREIIRNYFINDYYADHCSTFSVLNAGKRPIYWLFSSGKKNGFKALIYMHRYQPDLLARMRTDYVHEQQERYRTQLKMLEDASQTVAPSERVKLNKQITKLKDQALEIQKYEEKIHHLADQMISIDLDDGVKVNYAKFQDVLEKIK